MKRVTLGLAGLALAVSSPARADSFAWDNFCINDAFVVCASVRVNVSATGNLTMQVWNLEGMSFGGTPLGVAHTMTAIGLYHTGAWAGTGTYNSAKYVTGAGGTDVTGFWSTRGASDISTLGGVAVGLATGSRGNDGINGCTQLPGGTKWLTCGSFPGSPYMEFKFQLSGWDKNTMSASEFELRWHSQQIGPNGAYSLKCDTGGYGGYGPCSQVPEPFTIALLGSGLMGVGGVGFIRRRKKDLA